MPESSSHQPRIPCSPSLSLKWVPTSPTPALSIPPSPRLYDDRIQRLSRPSRSDSNMVRDATLHKRMLDYEHIVPTSQSCERELPIPEWLSAHYLDDSRVASDPEIIPSSQSQIETEMTPAWAESIAARNAEIFRTGTMTTTLRVEISSRSPTPCVVDTQDYDASDEKSPSKNSSPSLYPPSRWCSPFDISDIRTSPLRPPSRAYTDSALYPDLPDSPLMLHLYTTATMSPRSSFLNMFCGRDDDGNDLPRTSPPIDACTPLASPPPRSADQVPLIAADDTTCTRNHDTQDLDDISTSPPHIDPTSSYGYESFIDDCPTQIRLDLFNTIPPSQPQFENEFEYLSPV